MINKIVYTISARGKKENQPIEKYLRKFFPGIPFQKIDSVFGFVEASSLYGGRPFTGRQISDKDYVFLKKNNIGIRIPFTNHFITESEYQKNKKILDKYHNKGNSLIVTNDDLAHWIKRDYPLYQIEASLLKEVKTNEEINNALYLYDTVVLPMNLNNNHEFLKSIEQKSRITLFGNAGCALTCPKRICYEYISKRNKVLTTTNLLFRYLYYWYYFFLCRKWCTNRISPRKLHGLKDFDLDAFTEMGFSRFKMLREHTKRKTGY
ncbi:MAG: hypothetical protein JXK95_16805 [Bacteroidales bacterium]|nr:hypothetical protein [Bacteroidales bacterium]